MLEAAVGIESLIMRHSSWKGCLAGPPAKRPACFLPELLAFDVLPVFMARIYIRL